MVWASAVRAAGILGCVSWKGVQSREAIVTAAIIDSFCKRKLGDLAKASLKLALGRYQESPFTAADMAELRSEWFKLPPDQEKAKEVTVGQPFLLHALAQSLRLMGDPGTEVIDGAGTSTFVEGVHLGHLQPLGTTPQIYRPRVKEPCYDETDWALCMNNYFRGSEEEAERTLEAHFVRKNLRAE